MKKIFTLAMLMLLLTGLLAGCGSGDGESVESLLNEAGDVLTDVKDSAEEQINAAISADDKEDAPKLTLEEQNALRSAEDYLDFMPFSRSGLIDQLEYEGYSTEAATKAVDSLDVDWKEQAAQMAESYLDMMSFSRAELIDQLEYEGFSAEEAEYGVSAVGY